ncbi:MAG: hypothetical protein ABW123_12195, partial [Cystobacter sp.]
MKNKLIGSVLLACGWLGAAACTGDATSTPTEPDGAPTAPITPAPSNPVVEATSCPVTQDRVRITEVDVGATVVSNEDEVALKPLVIAPIPSGGSRLAWMGNDGKVHLTQLDASDHTVGTSFGLPANDFADLYADDTGGT